MILLDQAIRLNHGIPQPSVVEATKRLKQHEAIDAVSRNRQVYLWLSNGITVTFDQGAEKRTEFLRLIASDELGLNRWHAVNQSTVKGRKQPRRPDLVLYVNGIPLVVFEVKNPADANVDIWKAWNQIQTYKEAIPQLFETNLACVIADGESALMGSLTTPRERFMKWRVPPTLSERSPALATASIATTVWLNSFNRKR